MSIRAPGNVIRAAINKLNASAEELADALGVYPGEINTILQGGAPITPQMAVRLEIALKQPAEYWMSLQAAFDIAMVRQKGEVAVQLLKPIEKNPQDGQEGKNGLLLWDSVFEICSHIAGDSILSRKDEIPEEILEAFKLGRADGYLTAAGNLAYDKKSGKFGFLVTRFFACGKPIKFGDLETVGEYMGVKLACYDSNGDIANPPCVYFTAFIESPAKFRDVPAIFKVMSEIALNWNMVAELDIYPSTVRSAE